MSRQRRLGLLMMLVGDALLALIGPLWVVVLLAVAQVAMVSYALWRRVP